VDLRGHKGGSEAGFEVEEVRSNDETGAAYYMKLELVALHTALLLPPMIAA
jgi:hypothetical protein